MSQAIREYVKGSGRWAFAVWMTQHTRKSITHCPESRLIRTVVQPENVAQSSIYLIRNKIAILAKHNP